MVDDMAKLEGAPVPHGPRFPRFRFKLHRGSPLPAGGVPPTAEEAAQFNAGTIKKNFVEKAAESKVAKAMAVPVVGAVALEGAHAINSNIPDVPGIYRSVDQGVHKLVNSIQDYRDSRSPSKGDVFHPNAGSGEITISNTTSMHKEDAINLINQKTKEDKEKYFLLPSKAGEVPTLEYKIEYGFTGIRGNLEGSELISPYNGFLSWEKYENNGAMVIKIYEMPNKPGEIIKASPLVTFTVSKDANLLFPQEMFNTVKRGPEGLATISSSEVAVNAGQPVIKFTGNNIVPGAYEDGRYQLAVGNAMILSENNKAIIPQD